MNWDYFISHASEDTESALKLVESLEEAGASCFIDVRDVETGSQSYWEDIYAGITNSEIVLVLLSPFAQASKEVGNEVQVAHDHGRRLQSIWLSEQRKLTSPALAMLLSTVQWIDWGGGPVEPVRDKIRAITTVTSLRHKLVEYESVSTQLKIDLQRVLAMIDDGEQDRALEQVGLVTISVLSQLWISYEIVGAPPEDARRLMAGCRDHFQHESMLRDLSDILRAVDDMRYKPTTVEKAVRAVELLMQVLSLLRAQRWGRALLDPRLDEDARFLAGFMIEAGWLQGSELVPQSDVIYMLFERSGGNSTRSLEIVLGSSLETIATIAEESAGHILPTSTANLKTRFLVLPGRQSPSLQGTGGQSYMTTEDFVLAFTGVVELDPQPQVSELHSDPGPLTQNVQAALESGNANVLVYGAPGTGKSTALRHLALAGWGNAPSIRFYVDYALADQGSVKQALDDQLASRFPDAVRGRARALVMYLVRSGRAALLLDSIECAADSSQPLQTAQTFARLCGFLSERSHVILAGRDAPLRDSSTVREFFMSEPAVSEQLAQVFEATGVDSSSLPRFHMIRSRRNWAPMFQLATPRDRLIDAVNRSIWDPDETRASSAVLEVMGVQNLAEFVRTTLPVDRHVLTSLAVGGCPEGDALTDSDAPKLGATGIGQSRALREMRGALDYLATVANGRETQRWHEVRVGETARRVVRLLAAAGDWHEPPEAPFRLSLVGPPSSVLAIEYRGGVRLASATVTVAEFSQFLRALPDMPSSCASPDMPEGMLQPMYDRLPSGYFTDSSMASKPAVGVSWWAAESYARWCETRLPSSLEWEISGRSWDGRIFPWGDMPVVGNINCADGMSGGPLVDYAQWRKEMRANAIAPCNSRAADAASPNRSVGGQIDLVGNVWEWTATSVGSGRAIAGGSYDNPLRACVLSSRCVARAETRSNAVGFRIVECI